MLNKLNEKELIQYIELINASDSKSTELFENLVNSIHKKHVLIEALHMLKKLGHETQANLISGRRDTLNYGEF